MMNLSYVHLPGNSLGTGVPSAESFFPLEACLRKTPSPKAYEINVLDPQLSSGWLVEKGIFNLVKPFLSSPQGEESFYSPGGYAAFKYLDGKTARKILPLLPASIRAERQNLAPSVEELLQAAIKWDPLIRLNGYLIGPQRDDERISIDGFYLLDNGQIGKSELHPWTEINQHFQISSQAFPPDSCDFFSAGSGNLPCVDKGVLAASTGKLSSRSLVKRIETRPIPRLARSLDNYRRLNRWKLWWD